MKSDCQKGTYGPPVAAPPIATGTYTFSLKIVILTLWVTNSIITNLVFKNNKKLKE